MDAERIKYLYKRQEEVSRWLRDNASDYVTQHKLADVDHRLATYLTSVDDPRRHNLYEQLAARRFLQFLEKYEFKPRRVQKKVLCLESLPFPQKAGFKPMKLSSVQVFLLAGIYGFIRPDGRRLVDRAMLFVPRKFGKSTISSGIAIDELLTGDSDGQVYTCANSYQQAKICFDNIRKCLKALDKTGTAFKVNREIVFNQMKGRNSFARCLAADPSTLDGLNASLYILDEYSQAKSADLRNVMATSTGTRDNALELIITTASDVLDSPCVDTLESYKKVLLDEMQDDGIFALIFQPDPNDKENDPITWHKVQPHLGVTVKDDYYERKYTEALQTSENMLAFRTKLLNIFAVNETKSWISQDEIKDLYKPFDINTVEGRPLTMVSFDLSVWDDFSVVMYQIYDKATKRFHFHPEFYLPAETLDKHPNREMYRRWADKGFLNVLPGNVIDYDQIARDIVDHNGKLLIAGIGYDSYKSKQTVNTLVALGASSVMKPVKQSYGTFTGAVEALELLIKTKAATFSPNDIIAYCFGNCVMDQDHNGNKKPIKSAQQNKIDGAICALMTQYLYINFQR